MNRRQLGVRLLAAVATAALVVAFSARVPVAGAADNQQVLTFEVELASCFPPRGEQAAQILGGQSFTAMFQAHALWQYSLTVDQGSLQQLAVSVSGIGGPAGGYDQMLPPFDRSDVKVSWTSNADGPVSITVAHVIADPKTYDPDALPEVQSARVIVTAVPYDDYANEAGHATAVPLNTTISGRFELCSDRDAFSFFAEPGFDYRIDASISGVDYVTGILFETGDIKALDPSKASFITLARIPQAGPLIQGFNAVRSGVHYFVLGGAGNGANASYTVRISRTTITTTVNTADVQDDGTCDLNHCSLPEAVRASNVREGVQTIGFNIPGGGIHRIFQGLTLDLRESTVIDGTTQPGYSGTPLIVLDGKASGPTDGITVSGTDSTKVAVRGLAIINFQRAGINLASGTEHEIASNFIGLDPQTSLPAPNLKGGIRVTAGKGHLIGTPGSGNVIASNGAFGVFLDAGNLNGVTVQGNWIGTNPEKSVLGNNGPGLRINGGGIGVRVGGSDPGAANVFAHNVGPHIVVDNYAVRLEASFQGNSFAADRPGAKAVVANLATAGTLQLGGSGAGAGNTFAGPFGPAVEINVAGIQPVFEVSHAGNVHIGNSVALGISESPQGRVTITESANLFEGDGQAIRAELRASGNKSFGVGSMLTGSASAFATFLAEPAAGVHIDLALSGEYKSARASVTTRGEGSVDVRVTQMTVTRTLLPDVGLQIDVGASGNVTLDGFHAESHKGFAAVIEVGRFAKQPVNAVVEVKNSVVADSGVGITASQSAKSDVSWKFNGNVYRNNSIGLEVYADSEAKASYEMVANRFEAQSSVGLKASFNPAEGVVVQFSTSGDFYDSNLRHADFDIAGAGDVNIRVLDLKGTSGRGARNESGIKYRITADVKATLNTHVDIRRTSITGSLGFGLKAEAELPSLGKAFIEANASHFDGNREGAVIVGWSFRFSEEPNTFNDNTEAGIVAENAVVSVTNDTINANGTGVIIRNGSQVEIANNSISGNRGDGLLIESTRDASVVGNSMTGNGGAGVVLGPGATAKLTSNRFDGNTAGDVIGEAPIQGSGRGDVTPLDMEIRSAVLGPSGDVEVVYSIGGTDPVDFPLTIAFMKTDTAEPARLIRVHSETFASPEQASGELRTTIPGTGGHALMAGDSLFVVADQRPGSTSKPSKVTGSELRRQPTAPTEVATVGASGDEAGIAVRRQPTTEPTGVATVGTTRDDEEIERAEPSGGGRCGASNPAGIGLEYIMMAILIGGLVAKRVRVRSFTPAGERRPPTLRRGDERRPPVLHD